MVKANDRRLRRPVAIKLVAGRDPAMLARFEREALLTARLQHPGIVPIYEAGRWPNGESYYAMRLIEGRPLSDLIAACTSLDERLALVPRVVAVTEAVAYAHTERVIHRDLKPRNIVVGAHGEVMVVDWGLAKDLTEAEPARSPADSAATTLPTSAGGGLGSAEHTAAGSVMGTPAYMPPEQAAAEPVDERADVYALGAVLYHVLTGAPPFTAAGASASEVLRRVQAGPPEPVEVRQPGVPRDLAAIVGKAMQRDRDARYANAGELAADIKRFVTGQLVGARQYSRSARAARAVRRHPVVTAIAAFVIVGLVLGGVAVRRILAERKATESRSRALLLGQARAMVQTDPTAAIRLLMHFPTDATASETAAVRAIALDAESRGVARLVLTGHQDGIRDLWISPDDTEVASTGKDGALYLWNLATGAHQLAYQNTSVMDVVEYDPTGAYLAASLAGQRGVVLWDRRAKTARVLPTEDDTYAIAFSPDGKLLAAGTSGGRLVLWNPAGGEPRVIEAHDEWIAHVAFSPDSARLLTVSEDGTAKVWTVATGEAQTMALSDQGYIGTWSHDGALVAVGAVDGSARIYAIADVSVPVRELRGDRGAVDCIAFSHDDKTVVWAGMGEAVYAADLATGAIRGLHGHEDDVTMLKVLPDDSVVTASADGTVRHWDLATGLADVLRGHTDAVEGLAVSSDGRTVVSGSGDRTLRVWALPPEPHTFAIKASRESELRAPANNAFLYFHQDGHILTIVDAATGAIRTVTTKRDWARMAGNPTGTQVAYRDGTRQVALVDLATGTEFDLPDAPMVGRVMQYTSDGRTLLYTGFDGLYLVDVATHAIRTAPFPSGKLSADDPKVSEMVIGGDGAHAITAGKDLTRWDLAAATGVVIPAPPIEWPAHIAGTRDLATIVAGSVGGLAVHDATGWRTLLTTEHEVFPLAVSADDARLAAADDTGALSIWDLHDLAQPPVALVGHTGPIRRLEFSPDGRRLVSAGTDGAARIWDVATGEQLEAIRAHGGRSVELAGFHGADLITAGRDGSIRVWPAATREPGAIQALLASLTAATL